MAINEKTSALADNPVHALNDITNWLVVKAPPAMTWRRSYRARAAETMDVPDTLALRLGNSERSNVSRVMREIVTTRPEATVSSLIRPLCAVHAGAPHEYTKGRTGLFSTSRTAMSRIVPRKMAELMAMNDDVRVPVWAIDDIFERPPILGTWDMTY